jgi:branched-chain amino acid transport system substrate-binding protein
VLNYPEDKKGREDKKMERVKELNAVICTILTVVTLVFVGMSTAEAQAVKSKTFKIGWIGDLTGPIAKESTLALNGLQDLVSYTNEQGIIPGVNLEVVPYDNKYDASRTVTGYNYLKDKGVIGISAIYSFDGRLMKPLADRDKMIVVSNTGGKEVLTSPGWVFIVYPTYDFFYRAVVKWIEESWDYQKMGRNPILCTLSWDNEMGRSHLEDWKEWGKGKITFGSTEINPVGTMDFTSNLLRIKEAKADYVYCPLVSGPLGTAIKQAADLDIKSKFVTTAAGATHLDLLVQLAGWEKLQGLVMVAMWSWFDEDLPGVKKVQQLISKYRPGFKPNLAYLWSYVPGTILIQAMEKLVKDKKVSSLTPSEIHKVLETFKFDIGGLTPPLKFTATQRWCEDNTKMYEIKGETWVGVTKWFQFPRASK